MSAIGVIASCALAGVAATILISWSAAALSPIEPRGGARANDDPLVIGRGVATRVELWRGPCVDADDVTFAIRSDDGQPTSDYGVQTIRSGFPMRAMQSARREDRGPAWQRASAPRWSVTSGIHIASVMAPNGSVLDRRVPLRIIPLGFAIDVALWGGAMWLAIAWTREWRRRSRRRHGQCVACGQRLGDEQSRCPECGAERGGEGSLERA